ncbi:MAG: hypothetical protein BWX74_00533 [Tenericutes bacterium ADurb.Bin087]|nr:MAG: hypothetical protein BWX74_00533 [Tenericutes bacterium ADurb.Bin087]
MKKLFKGLFTTALAIGLLAGCTGGEKHDVVLSNYDGTHIQTIKVADGKKAKKPADPAATYAPAATGYTFRGWFKEAKLQVGQDYVAYDWETPVKGDVRLLALWEGETIYVNFYINDLGVIYAEKEIKKGHVLVDMPANPTRDGYEFQGWFNEPELETAFNPTKFIFEDKDVYPKWNKLYVPDTRTFHVVGSLANPDFSYINWNAVGTEGVEWDVRSYLEKATDSNLYSIELVIGFRGEFKIKIPNAEWDAELQFSYGKIREEDRNDENFVAGGFDNVQIINAGAYLIEIETTYEWLKVTRTGDIPEGSNATPNPEEGAIDAWGIVGGLNGWGDDGPDIALTYNDDTVGAEFYYIPFVKLPVGDFKLRANSDWGLNFGSHPDNVLPEGFTQPTELVDEVEVVKTGENITVTEGNEGWYRIYFDTTKIVITKINFALRGSALADGWDKDSAPLAVAGEVAGEGGALTLTLEGTYTFTDGKFKVKLGALAVGETELYSGWFLSFGDAEGQDISVTAGEHKVTLTLEVAADYTFTGAVTLA